MKTSETDLSVLNTATKYPSILTYHALGDKGRLTDERTLQHSSNLIVTEKIDGTNTRIIFMPDGYFIIGSREQLLYARGDLIGDSALGIVASIKDTAERLNGLVDRSDGHIRVAFFETYGGKTTAAAKNYTGSQAFGHRMFDICVVTPENLNGEIEAISSWRENGGQAFWDEAQLRGFSEAADVALTDRLDADALPTDHAGVLAWLEAVLPTTKAGLDSEAAGIPEGVVVRTPDRRGIAKIRYSDYRRTLKGKR